MADLQLNILNTPEAAVFDRLGCDNGRWKEIAMGTWNVQRALAMGLCLGIGSACGGDSGDATDNMGAASANDGASSGNGGQGDGSQGASPAQEQLDPEVDWNAFAVAYTPMYSAYDGVHNFSLPAYADGVATMPEDWQAIPSDAVIFEGWQSDDGSQQGVLITVVRPEPEVTIAVRSGELGGQATLHITEALPATWEVGEQRYMSGASFQEAMMDPEDDEMFEEILSMVEWVDGVPVFTGTAADLGFDTFLRCDSCHSSGAENFQVEHTPTQIAQFSDDDLVKIFTMGMKPPGAEFRVIDESMRSFYEFMHTWDVSDEQAQGLVVYLRSLTPKGQGEIIAPQGGGPPFGNNADPNKLPPSCNFMGEMFNFLQCQMDLPPECDDENPDTWDRQACEAMFAP